MKLSRKILIIWGGIISAHFLSLLVFPHRPSPLGGNLNREVQSLLFLIALFIFFHEPNRKNKFIFLNFVIFYSLSFLQYGLDFVGVAFMQDAVYRFAPVYYIQYLSIAYVVFLSVAVIYIVMDLLFRDFKVYQKY